MQTRMLAPTCLQHMHHSPAKEWCYGLLSVAQYPVTLLITKAHTQEVTGLKLQLVQAAEARGICPANSYIFKPDRLNNKLCVRTSCCPLW